MAATLHPLVKLLQLVLQELVLQGWHLEAGDKYSAAQEGSNAQASS